MPTAVTVDAMRDEDDVRAFRELNEEWIVRHFAIEDADRAVLDRPAEAITDRGGAVLIARDGDQRVGCVALLPVTEGVVELAKMAVAPDRRGSGIGRALITEAIATARRNGVHRVLLESNRVLVAAVRMYESAGFRHVPAAAHAPSPYARADVFMELDLR